MLQSAKSLTFSLSMGLISLFSFLYSQLTGMLLRAHTLTSPVSIRQFLLMTICACLKDQAQQNDTVTSYTITFISLFRKKKKKYPLTSTCPWIVMYLWTLYQMKPNERNFYYRKRRSIWRVLGLVPKGKCGRMCLQQIAMKKNDSLKSF